MTAMVCGRFASFDMAHLERLQQGWFCSKAALKAPA
jgi:hypothetical protein